MAETPTQDVLEYWRVYVQFHHKEQKQNMKLTFFMFRSESIRKPLPALSDYWIRH